MIKKTIIFIGLQIQKILQCKLILFIKKKIDAMQMIEKKKI